VVAGACGWGAGRRSSSTVGGSLIAAVQPLRATDPLPRDPDDPAIWINHYDPARSLVLGTMKAAAPDGALAVFGLDGSLQHLLTGPDRPNNVDVEYGLDLDATPTDIAVLTERLGRRLRVYAIAPDGSGSAMSRQARCRSWKAPAATAERRWASVSTGGRRTAPSSRSSRPKPDPGTATSGSTGSKTTGPGA